MLTHLQSINAGWAKQITEKLETYKLETNWNTIKQKTVGQWVGEVKSAIEKFNKDKLISNCTTTAPEGPQVNSKTRYIHEILTTTNHTRKPLPELLNLNKQRTRTIMFARTRMLQCGRNYKGTMPELCENCKSPDDENHRLNHCSIWQETNNYSSVNKSEFSNIYSEESNKLNHMIEQIENVWDMRFTNGRMKI